MENIDAVNTVTKPVFKAETGDFAIKAQQNAFVFKSAFMPEHYNENDMESRKCHCKGVLVRNYHDEYSNYRAQNNLDTLLKDHGVLGICDIDTRYLTKMIRDEGAMMMIASTEISDTDELANQ